MRDATRRLGADASFFARFVRGDEGFDSFRFLVACDPVWSLRYEALGCVSADPWLRYAQSHSEPAWAAHVNAGDAREQQTIDLAAKHGFKSAFIVPAPAFGGSRIGVLVLGSNQVDFFHDEGVAALKVVARGLAMELHERLAGVMQRELMSRCDLTASLLGCSAGAIDQRFHRLNGKLGVCNRGRAARLAAAYGLV